MTKSFKKGDKVRSGYWSGESHIVRKVLTCVASDCEGGWLVEADGGEACECCGRKGRPTPPLCITWFAKVEEK